jgi:hypothetical protein
MTPLRQRMLEDMQIRQLSPHTQRAYLAAVTRFAKHFGRSPADLGLEDIRTFQLHLVSHGIGHSNFTIIVSALRFLYIVTLRKDWRIDEIPPAAPSSCPSYSAPPKSRGARRRARRNTAPRLRPSRRPRVSEVVALKVNDIDSQHWSSRRPRQRAQRPLCQLSPVITPLKLENRPPHRLFVSPHPGEQLNVKNFQRVRGTRQAAGLADPSPSHLAPFGACRSAPAWSIQLCWASVYHHRPLYASVPVSLRRCRIPSIVCPHPTDATV